MPKSQRQYISTEGLDGVNQYIREVFKDGKEPGEVINELVEKNLVVTREVQILTVSQYDKNMLVYAETKDGNQYVLPYITGMQDVINKEVLTTQIKTNVQLGKLVHNNVESRYVSFDKVKTVGKTQVTGAVLSMLKPNGFVEDLFIILKIHQQELKSVPYDYMLSILDIRPGEFEHNAYELVTNFAPDVVGLDDVKQILLAADVGSGPPPKDMPDIRFTLNVMLVGPPGLAKTTLGRRLCMIDPRCAYITGSASTATSLLAPYDAVSKEIELGPMIILSGDYLDFGLVIIDESQKLKGVGELRTALEEGIVYVSKGGKNLVAETHVSTVFIMNPALGDWVPGEVMRNFPSEYDETILSRMDAIVLVPPITTEQQFANIVKTALGKFSGRVITQDNDLLYTYIRYARLRNVTIPGQVEDYILDKAKEFFNEMRKNGLHVDPRTAYNMIRVIHALAKLLWVDNVTNEFVDFVLGIQKTWLNRMGLGADSIYYAILSESEAKFAVSLLDMMRDSCVEGCTLGDIIQYIENLMNNNEKARDAIESMMSRRGYKTLAAYIDDVILSKLREKGDIYKCRENAYCVVR